MYYLLRKASISLSSIKCDRLARIVFRIKATVFYKKNTVKKEGARPAAVNIRYSARSGDSEGVRQAESSLRF
jgi:hypothetical protein